MAHKKGGGSTRNGRDSKSKRLGIKKYDGEIVLCGNIIVRQRGTKDQTRKQRGCGQGLHSLCDDERHRGIYAPAKRSEESQYSFNRKSLKT